VFCLVLGGFCRFNHKTGAEDVHFTSVLSDSDSDSEEPEPSTPGSADGTLEEAAKRGGKFNSSVDDSPKPREATKEKGKVIMVLMVALNLREGANPIQLLMRAPKYLKKQLRREISLHQLSALSPKK